VGIWLSTVPRLTRTLSTKVSLDVFETIRAEAEALNMKPAEYYRRILLNRQHADRTYRLVRDVFRAQFDARGLDAERLEELILEVDQP
jgi:hypothetical protein